MKHILNFLIAAAMFVAVVLPTLGPAAAQQKLFQYDPLIVAVFEDKTDEVRALLVRGHPTEVRDDDGRTALTWGAIQGNYDSMALLLEERLQIDTRDKFGNTALHYAAENDHLEVAELLLEYGANVNSENLEGRTPLMRAVESGRIETSKMLVDQGADVNRTDFTGRTVLDWARAGRSNRLIRLLEKAGAR